MDELIEVAIAAWNQRPFIEHESAIEWQRRKLSAVVDAVESSLHAQDELFGWVNEFGSVVPRSVVAGRESEYDSPLWTPLYMRVRKP